MFCLETELENNAFARPAILDHIGADLVHFPEKYGPPTAMFMMRTGDYRALTPPAFHSFFNALARVHPKRHHQGRNSGAPQFRSPTCFPDHHEQNSRH